MKSTKSPWKVAGINFDHMHMGDNLRMVDEHSAAEIVGVCDENQERSVEPMAESADRFDVPADR